MIEMCGADILEDLQHDVRIEALRDRPWKGLIFGLVWR
jgi:hypothetical protein